MLKNTGEFISKSQLHSINTRHTYPPSIKWAYLLTPWCKVLLEKLTGLQLVKKFPAFYGTRTFFTTFTSFRHPSLSWASPIQSTCPQPTSWRSILISSTHLRLIRCPRLAEWGRVLHSACRLKRKHSKPSSHNDQYTATWSDWTIRKTYANPEVRRLA